MVEWTFVSHQSRKCSTDNFSVAVVFQSIIHQCAHFLFHGSVINSYKELWSFLLYWKLFNMYLKEQICFPNPIDTFKIYPGSSNNTASRNTICRWFIRRHFQPETRVGFSPSIPRQVHGKTIPEIAVLSGSIVVVTVVFSIHPPKMKCRFVTPVRVVENISFKGGG